MGIVTRVYVLGWSGIARLTFAVLVVCIEFLFRLVVFCVPQRLLHHVPQLPGNKKIFKDPDNIPATMEMTTTDLIDFYGYISERHLAVTEDGYFLTLHRIVRPVSEPPSNVRKPPVFIMHGLMQSSESWVCVPECLPFMLASKGFDVWLGNTRGNKYSCKHARLKPHQHEFWDFSLDEMGRYDVPANINYILKHTGFEQLGYVGFSQGTGQAFACFSLQKEIAQKVNLFVCLSPAAKAHGLNQGMLKTFMQIAPQSLFLFFGTRAMLSTAEFWRSALSRTTYARLIDRSCRYLFAWSMDNMGSVERKQILYSHLFSFASVKTIVHWFQIAVCDRFQVYDENQNYSKGYQAICPMKYPIRQVSCPMAVFYGTTDELTDIPWLLKKLPPSAPVRAIEGYEHLDLMWATDAHIKVFPEVAKMLQRAVNGLPASDSVSSDQMLINSTSKTATSQARENGSANSNAGNGKNKISNDARNSLADEDGLNTYGSRESTTTTKATATATTARKRSVQSPTTAGSNKDESDN
eukprot:m.55858 g.55858  ORF g.55858 m.55858 type:complete len:523 (+) comp13352_c0_seq1:49-1617(+)